MLYILVLTKKGLKPMILVSILRSQTEKHITSKERRKWQRERKGIRKVRTEICKIVNREN